jgi:integrase-like protein
MGSRGREAGIVTRPAAQAGPAACPSVAGPELRALRRVQRDMPRSPYGCPTERGSPMTSAGCRKRLARLGDASTLAFPVHPHMLRHACGDTLANDGHDTRAIPHYLGHKHIQHTVHSTVLQADRFTHFGTDSPCRRPRRGLQRPSRGPHEETRCSPHSSQLQRSEFTAALRPTAAPESTAAPAPAGHRAALRGVGRSAVAETPCPPASPRAPPCRSRPAAGHGARAARALWCTHCRAETPDRQ